MKDSPMHFLADYPAAFTRYRAGAPVPEGAIPTPQLVALVEAGIVSAPAAPAPAPAHADEPAA
jgi:hypothetical protein